MCPTKKSALKNSAEATSTVVIPERTLTRGVRVKDAAAYLGVTVSFIRHAVWSNKLPAAKLGKRLVLDIRDLDAFFDMLKRECAA